MTVANQSAARPHLAKRLQQIDPLLDQVVLAARQLQITQAELAAALLRKWETSDE